MQKPQLFYIGQAVALNEDDEFEGACDIPDPQHGQVYHVRGYRWHAPANGWGIYLEEFPNPYCYDESAFVPVDDALNDALSELLTEPAYA